MDNIEQSQAGPVAFVTGSDGSLGVELCAALERAGYQVIPSTIHDMDVSDGNQVDVAIKNLTPDYVFHLAAYTQVDEAEEDEDTCFAVNAEGAKNIAMCCAETGAKMIYLSADYVFAGRTRERVAERAVIDPLCVCGMAKAKGEEHVAGLLPDNHLIVRTSWLMGPYSPPGRSNFIETVLDQALQGLTVRAIRNQRGSPTFTFDLAETLVELLRINAQGVIHARNEDECSWMELAAAVLQEAGLEDTELIGVSIKEVNDRAPAPMFSILDTSRLRELGLQPLPHWKDSLKDYFRRRRGIKGEIKRPGKVRGTGPRP